MSTDHHVPGWPLFSSSSDSSKSSTRRSSNGSNAALPTIVEIPEDDDTRGDQYVSDFALYLLLRILTRSRRAGFPGVLQSRICSRCAAIAALRGFALGMAVPSSCFYFNNTSLCCSRFRTTNNAAGYNQELLSHPAMFIPPFSAIRKCFLVRFHHGYVPARRLFGSTDNRMSCWWSTLSECRTQQSTGPLQIIVPEKNQWESQLSYLS